ncbi:unnamed protein product [Rotaria socialis]|uniref:Uncharacterized protein n=1 Tax=Rotaria socialis TaxID=392032 RepID=A0A820JQ12_9BILA|nr:unnamed protein product [Rotaria socialis]CAF4782985.1 unnamed protein product [Rotaria socialis]
MSFFFADDLAAVLPGQIAFRFTDQCIDLERRLQSFLDQLEFYSILSVQPINYAKTQAMFWARAIVYPNMMPQGSRTPPDKALHTALEAQQQFDSQSTGKEDQQQTNNKNQGLINTEINNGKQTSIPSISEHISTGKGSDKKAMKELKLHLEKQLVENNIRHNELIQMFKGGSNNPVQAEVP